MFLNGENGKIHDCGMKEDIVVCLRELIENEMRSCSMDIGGITPEYVQRMWGGRVPLEDIKAAMGVLKTTLGSM